METTFKKVRDMIDSNEDCPLPLSIIPNYMGINLCSVDAISWQRQDDGQLINLTIHFSPSPNAPVENMREFIDVLGDAIRSGDVTLKDKGNPA